MAFIESHQKVERHRKTKRLMSIMNWSLDITVGKLHRFWWWALDYAEDGDLSRFTPEELGDSVGLSGDTSSRWVEAMLESGWFDREPYFRIHDWWDYVGAFLRSKYKRNKEKWEAIRDKCLDKKSTCNGYVTVTQPLREGYVTALPNLTIPNQAKEEEKEPFSLSDLQGKYPQARETLKRLQANLDEIRKGQPRRMLVWAKSIELEPDAQDKFFTRIANHGEKAVFDAVLAESEATGEKSLAKMWDHVGKALDKLAKHEIKPVAPKPEELDWSNTLIIAEDE
jgi:hypothetical protein